MSIRNAIASLAVKDFKSALPWYEKLLGRGPDRADQKNLVEWVFEQGGRLQLHQQPERAGRGSLTLAVGSLDTEMLQLNRWGINPGDVIRSSAQRILVIEDPDGNTISLAEMLLPAPREGAPSTGPIESAKGPHPLEVALESIAAEPRLSARTVSDFLDNLIVDLEALLRASEESMTGPQQDVAAQLLQRAHIVRQKITPSSVPA
jgi:catechol 2,3-dioxygenase-like lactoylglutathione lyase family enzyme